MQILTLNNIIDTIKCQNCISDYRVLDKLTTSYELFFVHSKIETVRKAVSESKVVTVYVDHDDKRGNSTFEVFSSMTEDELKAKLEDAISNSLNIFDEPYTLPENTKLNVTLPSNLEDMEEKEVAAKIAAIIDSVNNHKGCDINALEIFVTKTISHVVNSRGVDCTQTKHIVNLEVIPTANGKNESVELFECYSLSQLDEKWLADEIADRLTDVKARLEAKKPKKKLTCPVVFNPYELVKLFEELTYDANYGTAYSHLNVRGIGDALQSAPQADKLNVTMKSFVKGSPESAYFDADGTPLKDRQIVKDGIVVAQFGSHRFAEYMGEEPTGSLACIDVECGSTPTAELLATPHLELVYLSGLQVDLYSDYIGGEIRLAYYFDGEKRIPVTGIAMSGKLSDVLNTAVLSKEHTVLGAYSGPAKIKLDGFNIF